MKKIIEVKNLSFKYDKEYIFENISFEIDKGDFLGIIGSNGAGKSTLIKLILGQLKPDKGCVLIDGVNSCIGKTLQEIGYVAQVGLSRGVDFPATVEEIVAMNLYKERSRFDFFKNKYREKVIKALEIVDMTEFIHRKFSDLSGGQQQRVVIAKAIVNSPEILILDEPTTGIDHRSEEVLYELLDKLHREKKITIVMISHDLEKIKAHSNRLIKIEDFEGENKC